MVPPGKSYYFYSFGGEKGEAMAAIDQPHVKPSQSKHVRAVRFTEIQEEKKVVYTQGYYLKSINFVYGTQQTILNKDYEPIKFQVIVPRLADNLWERRVNERPRTPWSFPISIFKDYQIENDAKINECFEVDWSNMKFP